MTYFTFDTCVWLELLKANYHIQDNLFEQILFLIEKGHITCVTTENLRREWDRHKRNKKDEIINDLKKANEQLGVLFKDNDELHATYRSDNIADIVEKRIARIDQLLNSLVEEAKETEEIYIRAVSKNLNCLAPNHDKDSFRDTVNLECLITYLKSKGYGSCFFVTLNYKDFSEAKSNKQELHKELVEWFASANLQFIYFDDNPKNYAGKFKHVLTNLNLPTYTEHLKQLKKLAEDKKFEARKMEAGITLSEADGEFLDNTRYMDVILSKRTLNTTDRLILELLIKKGQAYQQYFLKNVSPNGMV